MQDTRCRMHDRISRRVVRKFYVIRSMFFVNPAILSKMEKPEAARIIRIRNTFSIDTFIATETLFEDIGKNEALSVMGEPMETVFNADHALAFE